MRLSVVPALTMARILMVCFSDPFFIFLVSVFSAFRSGGGVLPMVKISHFEG